jgi:hypothetical protein
MPPLEVGFEVVVFGPFVLGVDEHDGFREAIEGGAIGEHGAETEAVVLGSRGGAAGGVVPGGHHAGEAGVVDWGAGQHGGHHLGVGEHADGAERMGARQAELVEQFPAAGWLAWGGERSPVGLEDERGVEAIELGAPLALCGEALHLHQIEAFEAAGLCLLAPEGDGISNALWALKHRERCIYLRVVKYK